MPNHDSGCNSVPVATPASLGGGADSSGRSRRFYQRCRSGTLEPATARDLGIAFIASLEGAFVLARGLKSTEPMYAAARATVAATKDALDHQPKSGEGEGT